MSLALQGEQVSQMTKFAIVSLTSSLLLTFGMDVFAAPKKAAKGAANAPAVLWQEPADIASRDMIYGPGGQEHQPKAPFKFVKEDMNGTSPKFVVTDADGTKWKVKLGLEAHPETAANRLVYAAGYYAD